jgi:hypothetical protein
MNNIKVKVIFEFKNASAAEVLPLGFETELIPKKGSVNDLGKYTFKGANGETYGDHWIYLMIGYKSIGEIFEKI